MLNKVDGNTVINNVTVRWCCVRLRSITLIITVVFVEFNYIWGEVSPSPYVVVLEGGDKGESCGKS